MQFLTDIKHLFFPNICLSCDTVLSNGEEIICTSCFYNLPLTNYTLENNGKIAQLFYGRISLINATALLFFQKKGIAQHLIHNLKYYKHQEIGVFLGRWLGAEMNESKNFNTIDFVIPVPLHKKRLKKRGFNQVSKFAKEISIAINAEFNEVVLVKKEANKTLSKRDRIARLKGIDSLFILSDLRFFENCHILLVDDIITTGATMEACCLELLKAKNIKISIAAMAITV